MALMHIRFSYNGSDDTADPRMRLTLADMRLPGARYQLPKLAGLTPFDRAKTDAIVLEQDRRSEASAEVSD